MLPFQSQSPLAHLPVPHLLHLSLASVAGTVLVCAGLNVGCLIFVSFSINLSVLVLFVCCSPVVPRVNSTLSRVGLDSALLLFLFSPWFPHSIFLVPGHALQFPAVKPLLKLSLSNWIIHLSKSDFNYPIVTSSALTCYQPACDFCIVEFITFSKNAFFPQVLVSN